MINNNFEHSDLVRQIKDAVLKSRYIAASLANRELLSLYYYVGRMISERSGKEKWGSKVIDKISNDLQSELPGVRGFSASNLKKMRVFYEAWNEYIKISSSSTNQLLITHNDSIGSLSKNQFQDLFSKIGFTVHFLVISQVKALEERLFYLQLAASKALTVDSMKYYIKSDFYNKKGALPNNFVNTIDESAYCQKAVLSFKDEYLLDYVNIEDPDEEDERIIENEIVRNIKKFIMSLGSDFTFIGNQYRVVVDEDEFFIDLLFFNRDLQCLVAFELKKGKFKPEYLGKMNFYLSALDDCVKKAHENPSIGIILCKEKNNKIVEFAFRDTNKPMGVATFKTIRDLPEEYRKALPNEEDLKKLMNEN